MESFTPELKRLLLAAGCSFVRAGKGDHEIWRSLITKHILLSIQRSSHGIQQMQF
jgi:hypothetical protein